MRKNKGMVLMSGIQEIDVYIQDNGDVRIEVRGAKGSNCLDLTAQAEELLGAEVSDRELTDEYYDQEQQEQNEQTQDC